MELLHDISKINIGSLNFFDLSVVTVIGISILLGAYRGFVKSAVSFAGWIVAFVMALKFSHNFIYIFEKYISSAAIANVATTCALFSLFALVLAILNSFIIIVIEPVCGGILDRAVGLFFGLIRGLCLVSVVFYFMITLLPVLNVKEKADVFEHNAKLPNWAKNTESLLLLAKGANLIENYLPNHFKEELKQSLDESTKGHSNFALFARKPEKTRSLDTILNLLPEEVANEMSQEDIIHLHDPNASHETKIHVLETMADLYQKYNSLRTDRTSKNDLHQLNKEHHHILNQIEEEIQKHNKLIDKP